MRLDVKKTYKIFIGGKFPRTESGRYYPLHDKDNNLIANISLCSRKDFRNAVVAARLAFKPWSKSSAYLKGQILYRMAEMLEGRKDQFIEELVLQGYTKKAAEKETGGTIDLLVYYAGWSDKFQQVFSSVNPVASSHFNFSIPEPSGVVSVILSAHTGLIGLVDAIAPVIVGGNTSVVLVPEKYPLCAVTLGEVFNTSDLPGGVVNILTGKRSELIDTMTSHMDVNGILYFGDDADDLRIVQENASLNIKRVKTVSAFTGLPRDPYGIMEFQEIKTTWHPVGV